MIMYFKCNNKVLYLKLQKWEFSVMNKNKLKIYKKQR